MRPATDIACCPRAVGSWLVARLCIGTEGKQTSLHFGRASKGRRVKVQGTCETGTNISGAKMDTGPLP